MDAEGAPTAGTDAVLVRVHRGPADDAAELAELTDLLRSDLLELDVRSVDPVAQEGGPDRSKGLGLLAGLLTVQLGSGETLRAVLGALRTWVTRTNREVEISLGGDVLRVTGASSAQQEKIIDAWLARHATDA